MKYKAALFTNIAPHYRAPLWYKILLDDEYEFHFYYGESYANRIKSIDVNEPAWKSLKNQLHALRNVYILGRLIFQRGVISRVINQHLDAVILLGDINIISNWIALIIMKFKNVPVITWGHGMYGDEKSLKKFLRSIFYSLADQNLVYSNWGRSKMIEAGLDAEKVSVIYNSLDYETSKALRNKVLSYDYFQQHTLFKNKHPVLIFIGRLTVQKKLHLLIEAVKKLYDQGQSFNLLIIGDGTEKENLIRQSRDLENICFYGPCYEEEKIATLIANADLCVSPGNVGLTAIHALSYGTPVCTHNDFANQMPEFEAIEEGKSGTFFDWKKQNLAATISDWFKQKRDRSEIRSACYNVIDTHYNPENQTKILKDALARLLI